jgi:hypothetical protein
MTFSNGPASAEKAISGVSVAYQPNVRHLGVAAAGGISAAYLRKRHIEENGG